MKKYFAVLATFVAISAFSYLSSCNDNKTDSPAGQNNEDSIKKVIERGDYLANHVAACIHCHSKRDFNKFSGPVIPGTEGGGGQVFSNEILDAIPGVFYGKNITPDNETGIGTWTDDEILRAITHGISKKGDTLFALMPYVNFNRMAKDDLMAIIAYLRTLKPVKNKIPERKMMIPIAMAYPAQALQPTLDNNVRPAVSDIVKYGEYMATVADCATCHTPFVKGQLDFSRMYGGGNTFHIGKTTVNAANISSDTATGLGSWTEERFLNKFIPYREEKGYNYDPGNQNTVMPLVDYAGMTDADLKAIYAYLHTAKPVKNTVEKYPK